MTQGDRNQAGTDPNSLKRNKELVDQALEEILVPGLKPFIQRKMKAKYGKNWLQDARLGLQDYHFEGDDLKWKDPQVVLKLILDQWNDAFRQPHKFDYSQRSLVSELLEVRNAVKHNDLQKFDNDYTYRALDSMARLLTATDTKKAAQEIEQQKEEFRRQWLRNVRVEEEPEAVISNQLAPVAELLGVRHPFQALIEEKTQGFVGRGFVFEAIEEFLKKQPKGYFFIEGEPGIGKSAILAKYVQKTGCVAHFNVRSQGITSVDRFLKNICTQLISRYNLPYPSLPPDATRDGQFFAQLLGEVSAKLKTGERLVIAIDALDEVERTDHTGANLLYLPTRLDKGVYFVMTQRPGTLPLTVNTPPHQFDLMQHQEQSLQDIQTYIRGEIKKSSQLQAVAMTPDGQRAICVSSGCNMKVWDLENGVELQTLEGHVGSILTVAVTPDGKLVISGSSDCTIKVWNLESGTKLHTLEGHTDSVKAVAVTPDGQRLISGSYDNTLKVWDLESWAELHTLEGHTGSVMSVAVTADGQRVISGSDDGTIKVWNLESGIELYSLECHSGSVWPVAVTPDGQRVISASSSDANLRVWDLKRGAQVQTPEGHTDKVGVVVVTPDGQQAISASEDGILKVWEIKTGKALRTLEGHISPIRQVVVTPDGQWAISGSLSTLKVWDIQRGVELHTLKGHTDWVRQVVVTPDGRRAISASDDCTLKVWDLESGAQLYTLEGHSNLVWAVGVTPHGHQAISGSNDSTFKIWDLESGVELYTLKGHGNPFRQVEVTADLTVIADGQQIITRSKDTLKLWDLESGEVLHTLEHDATSVWAVAVTADGQRAICGTYNGTVKVWDLESGKALHTLDHLHTLEGYIDCVRAVAVTPDGQRAISASRNILKVWDLERGQVIVSFNGDGELAACAIAPDGLTIVAGEQSGRVHFLNLEGSW